MPNNKKILNEKGTALLVALIMLLLLTLIGFAAITTSTIEVQISGNQRLANTAMYAAEAAIESIRQRMNNYSGTADAVIDLAGVNSATPYYQVFSGIQKYPQKGDSQKGDLWTEYNNSKVIIPNRSPDGSPMYVFIVEGSSGFAVKRIDVGIALPEKIEKTSGETPNPSGTGYLGGSS